MNIIKSTLTAALLVSSTFASAVTFVSSTDDVSSSASATTSVTPSTWIDPTGTVLDGATWIQPSDAYDVDQSAYSFYEVDLGDNDYTLTSLFMSFDDHVIVSIGDAVIFDSLSDPSEYKKSWTNYHNVFDGSLTTLINAANKLTFAITNSGNGPTGVIWKGTATVPEPSMLFVLGLGLVAFAYKRKKSA